MRKIFTALLALFVAISGLSCRALAAQLPDLNRRGCITFRMEFDGVPLDGGSLTLYRVGQVAGNGGQFTLVEPLQKENPSLENLQDPALARKLAELSEKLGLDPITVPVKKGSCVFPDLELGLYVVAQRPGEEVPGYAPIDPFLISLPQWKDNAYLYDLTAAPKVPLEPAPTEEPTEETEPTVDESADLPQTGQLNWPVPLMAILGLAFFGLGWSLYFGAKRRQT